MKTAVLDRKLAEPSPRVPVPLYVLSDSTGNLARHMVASFLTQFPAGTFQALVRPFVSQPQRFLECLKAISARPGIVLHAVVSPRLKKQIAARCRAMNVPCWDLTGSAVDFLAKAARLKPECDPRRLHRLDQAYCGRINAMTFTLEHDDSLGLDTLGDADVVLAGVSRTGKTPTSIFLAMQGFRAANISLARAVATPNELFAVNPRQVVGLVIDPVQLTQIRTRRQTAWHMTQTSYNAPRDVADEIEWSRTVFARLGCPVLDVTGQAIEETAARIIEIVGLPDQSGQFQTQELL